MPALQVAAQFSIGIGPIQVKYCLA